MANVGDLEKAYVYAQDLLNECQSFWQTLAQLYMARIFLSAWRWWWLPNLFRHLSRLFITLGKRSRALILKGRHSPEVREFMAELSALRPSTQNPASRDYDLFQVYAGLDRSLGMARLMQKDLGYVDFNRLLSLHALTTPPPPFFSNWKGALATMGAVLAFILKLDIKPMETLGLKLSYAWMPADLHVLASVYLVIFVVMALGWWLFIDIPWRERHDELKRLFTAGQLIQQPAPAKSALRRCVRRHKSGD